MNFQDVKLLSYEHRNNFWGDSGLEYGATISMSIKGYILNLDNASGVKNVFQACKSLADALGSQQDIVINQVNYGLGKITNVSFDSGNWVKVTEYTVSIEILKEGNLTDLANDESFKNKILSSISATSHFLEEFSESYSIDYSSNDDSINGTHSIDIKYSSLFPGDKIASAKNLADVLYSKTFIEDLSKIAYKKPVESLRKDFYSETYDKIDGKCGFKRNFSYANNADCYTKQRSLSVSLEEDGIATITESNKINGNCLQPDLFGSAEIGFASEITGAFLRCSGALNNYKIPFGIQSGLVRDEVNRSVKRNKFNGEIEYSVVFSNDQRRKGLYFHEYTLDISREQDYIWNVSEAGSIRGSGRAGEQIKFDNAYTGWKIESPGISGRASGIYYDQAKIKPVGSSLKLINKTIDFEQFDGVVSYNFSFTDDLNLNMDSEIRRTVSSITDSKPTMIHNDFIIIGGASSYAVAQPANQSKQGELDIKSDLEISSLTVPFVGNKYLNSGFRIATGVANDYSISENGTSLKSLDGYLETLSFTTDEIQQTCTLNAKFKYSKKAT
jgi:hypothetical protein